MAKTTKAAAGKVKALSLHLGLNSVSPTHYGGWSGDLMACEFDAQDMSEIARSKGMKPTVLMTKDATRARTLEAIRAAAKQLKSGGFFFLTFSGHGGQIPDVTGEEDDKKDETWCLYDGQLIDDELYLELSRFRSGVRILVFSDSCHSGTVTREPMPGAEPAGGRSKMMPLSVGRRTYAEHKTFYDKLQKDVAKESGKSGEVIDPDTALAELAINPRLTSIVKKFRPAVILISGCQDNQTSLDGDHNGAFTEQLLRVWNHGAFKGNYARFYATIKSKMPPYQTPNFFTLGNAVSFVNQETFS